MTMISPGSTDSAARVRGKARSTSLTRLTDCLHCPIRPTSLCSVLDRDDLAAFESLGQNATFAPRSVLFMEGALANAIYNVTAGLARLFRLLPDGRRQIVGFALPGDFLGVPRDSVYSFSADAAVPTAACRFPRQSFVAFANERPHVLRRLADSAERALGLAHEQMMLLGPRRAEAKVAAFILGIRERWAGLHGASMHVPLPMSRQDISDYLGLSIATVSRTLHRLADEKLILIVPKGVRILDPQRLERTAEA